MSNVQTYVTRVTTEFEMKDLVLEACASHPSNNS